MTYRELPAVLIQELSYNPDDVNVRLQHFRVYEIVEMLKGDHIAYDSEYIELMRNPSNPSDRLSISDDDDDLQRNGNLWSNPVKSRFIESLMIRLPIPALYFDGSQKPWRIIDGLQRIHTILSFIEVAHPGHFKLSDLDFLAKECSGKSFSTIPGYLRSRVLNAELIAYVINPGSPSEVKYNIFKRINTGGLKLNAQEIRNAFCKGIPADLTKKMASLEIFKVVTDAKVTWRRMIDREYATRFIAFQVYDYKRYNSNLDLFLTLALKELEKMGEREREGLAALYEKSLDRIYLIFGNASMHRYNRAGKFTTRANKALFDTLIWNFSRLSERAFENLLSVKNRFVDGYQKEFQVNEELYKSISDTTGKKNSVITRFEKLGEFISNYTR